MHDKTICIVGLGYVGLPLAHAFASKGFSVIGYDINEKRVEELSNGHDATNELSDAQLADVHIEYSSDPSSITKGDIVVAAIPTPVDENKKPDIRILKSATTTIGQHMKPGAIIVFESTVYPGTTEDICGPILEQESGLTCGKDFFLGYSPERVNPGDKEHTIDKIIKVVAGQDEQTTDTLCALYSSIITAGVHRSESIKVAEMAKAIENAQRDLNIAFVNEVAMLCTKIGIPTQEVLDAARTKWNFLPFQPGLVGGHCIGVDPYYLVEKAAQLGMTTEVITAGRATNDGMSAFVAEQIVDALPVPANESTVLVLGYTFKEDVPDTRNTRVVDVIKALEEAGCTVHVHDPLYSAEEIQSLGCTHGTMENGPYQAIALLVPHKQYKELSVQDYCNALTDQGVLYDLKSLLPKAEVESHNRQYRAL